MKLNFDQIVTAALAAVPHGPVMASRNLSTRVSPSSRVLASNGKRALIIHVNPDGEGHHIEQFLTGYSLLKPFLENKGWEVNNATDNSEWSTKDSLSDVDVVVHFFSNSLGLDYDDAEKEAFIEWYNSGGKGWVGVHNAGMGEGWPWFFNLVGAKFRSHPDATAGVLNFNGPGLEGTVHVEDVLHPATAHLPANMTFEEEWYNFKFAYEPPQSELQVLLTVGEDSYALSPCYDAYSHEKPEEERTPDSVYEDCSDHSHGDDHPLAWFHEFENGRSFYTSLGHNAANWAADDEWLLEHIAGGMEWAGNLSDMPAMGNSSDQPVTEKSKSGTGMGKEQIATRLLLMTSFTFSTISYFWA